MMNKIFYITSFSTGIKHCCVTPLYCNNSVQQQHAAAINMHNVTQGWVYINISGIKTSVVFEHNALNSWFESKTTVAMQYYSTSVATQGTMP